MTLPRIQIMELDESQFDSSGSLSLLLPDDEIHLWLASTAAFEPRAGELAALLSAEEIERMRRFQFREDRMRFAISHGILRVLIAQYLNISPLLVAYLSAPGGKPELLRVQSEDAPCLRSMGVGMGMSVGTSVGTGAVQPKHAIFSFNISHSGQVAAFAFAQSRRIGVDVEHVRDLPDFQDIAGQFFHPVENSRMQHLSLSERQLAFFECWTGKEAFVKATGEGLSRPLDSFFISHDERDDGLLRIRGVDVDAEQWRLAAFRYGPDYVGALAFEADEGAGKVGQQG